LETDRVAVLLECVAVAMDTAFEDLEIKEDVSMRQRVHTNTWQCYLAHVA
jgi:hypothetical protein